MITRIQASEPAATQKSAHTAPTQPPIAMARVDNNMRILGFNTSIARNEFLAVDTPDFKQRLFDKVFNFARRNKPTIDNVLLNQWRDQYTPNFNKIKGYTDKLTKLPAAQQRSFCSAMEVANVLTQADPIIYTKPAENMLNNPHTADAFLREHTPKLETLAAQAQEIPEWKRDIRPMMHMGLLTSAEGLSFLNKASPQTQEKLATLKKLSTNNPDKPRVLLFWNSREGEIGKSDPEVSEENAELTNKLQQYWQEKGAEVLIVDGSGGASGQDLAAKQLMAHMRPSGLIIGGGPDVTVADPFVKNLGSMIQVCKQHDVPYFGECLGHQLTGMLHSKTTPDYLKYVGKVPNRAEHSPHNLSTLDTRDMEDHHALYSGPLSKILQKREKARFYGEEMRPLHGYCIHNNTVNPLKRMEGRVHIAARAVDGVPEIIARQGADGKRYVIGTQFHPSKFTVAVSDTMGVRAQDIAFARSILATVHDNMAQHFADHYHKKNVPALQQNMQNAIAAAA